jgi:transposase-like protein
MRKSYDKEFKSRVAIEAIRGEKTVQEIATMYSVHPNLVGLWKKLLIENASKLFEKEGKDKEAEAAEMKEDDLLKQIGQLQVENVYLKKKYRQWYGTEPKL